MNLRMPLIAVRLPLTTPGVRRWKLALGERQRRNVHAPADLAVEQHRAACRLPLTGNVSHRPAGWRNANTEPSDTGKRQQGRPVAPDGFRFGRYCGLSTFCQHFVHHFMIS